MDWVRAAYYQFMVTTGLADTYRNEQFLPRFDFFYNFERNMLALNFANPDKAAVARNLIVHLNFNLKALISVVTGENLI
jgi:hypothetical protein